MCKRKRTLVSPGLLTVAVGRHKGSGCEAVKSCLGPAAGLTEEATGAAGNRPKATFQPRGSRCASPQDFSKLAFPGPCPGEVEPSLRSALLA